ncbi:MAG: PQQ-binding-like beta-propeller repeat protein [Egibacteraceae bacterium]
MIDNLGPAASGFPANAAEWVGDRLYVVTLGLQPALLAEYDPARRVVTATRRIPTGLRCWGMATIGRRLYLAMWGTGDGEDNLYCFDTDARTLEGFRPVKAVYLSMAVGPDGQVVYLGTTRSGVVHAWRPDTGAVSELRFEDTSGSEVTALAATAHTLYVGLGRKQAGLVAIDRSSGAARHILPRELAGGVGVYSLAVSGEVIAAGTQDQPAAIGLLDRDDPADYRIIDPGGEHAIGAIAFHERMVYFSGISSGTLYGFDQDRGELASLATPVASTPTRRTRRLGTALVGVTAPGVVFDYDLESGGVIRTDLLAAGAEGGVERPQSLAVIGPEAAGDDAVVVVGTNNAAQVHGGGGSGARRMVVSGEVKTATAIGPAAYLATYPSGQLWRTTGGPAWHAEQVADWPDAYNRPRAIHHDAEAGLLLIAANADFTGGGALVVTDSSGTLLHVHADPLGEGQEPNAVTAFEGAAVLGGVGDDARLVALDPRTGRRLWGTVPVPGGGRISGLACRDRAIYGLTRNATLFRLDATTREVTKTVTLAGGRTGEVLVHGDAVYAVDGRRLVKCHLRTLYPTPLMTGIAHVAFTPNPPLRLDARGRLYLFDGTDLVRVTDPHAPPR